MLLPIAIEAADDKNVVRDISALRLVLDREVKVGFGAVNAFTPTKRVTKIELFNIILFLSFKVKGVVKYIYAMPVFCNKKDNW